jgi:hypothetical protein
VIATALTWPEAAVSIAKMIVIAYVAVSLVGFIFANRVVNKARSWRG